eukprot:4180150-Prymnesium_polylepis.1
MPPPRSTVAYAPRSYVCAVNVQASMWACGAARGPTANVPNRACGHAPPKCPERLRHSHQERMAAKPGH